MVESPRAGTFLAISVGDGRQESGAPEVFEKGRSMRTHISSGSRFERDIGYARAVVDGDWVFVSGTTGFDYATGTIAADVVAQARQCIAKIAAALGDAGFSVADIVRVRYILPERDDFAPCWPVLREHFGAVQPAATMIVAGLADPRMRIEIEVTGRRRTG